MNQQRARGLLFLCMFVVMLFVFMLPSNTLSGRVVEDSCRDGGCLELCDTTCTDENMRCCQTNWDSGVCAYANECDALFEYSLYQSLEVYQDTLRTRPDIHLSTKRFWMPLLAVGLLLCYFMYRRKQV